MIVAPSPLLAPGLPMFNSDQIPSPPIPSTFEMILCGWIPVRSPPALGFVYNDIIPRVFKASKFA